MGKRSSWTGRWRRRSWRSRNFRSKQLKKNPIEKLNCIINIKEEEWNAEYNYARDQVSTDMKDLRHITPLLKAPSGEKGYKKDCFGKNAEHTVVKVPVGTIVRNTDGDILADLDEVGMMFIAARGGAGGHGNAFFSSDTQQSPLICEYGAQGEEQQYVLEVRSMAHIGLVRYIFSTVCREYTIGNVSRRYFFKDWFTECWKEYPFTCDFTG